MNAYFFVLFYTLLAAVSVACGFAVGWTAKEHQIERRLRGLPPVARSVRKDGM